MGKPVQEMGVPPDYAERIKALRLREGLTQGQLAERLGTSFVSVNRWEKAKAKPSMLAWRQIAHAEQHGFASVEGAPTDSLVDGKAAAPAAAWKPSLDFQADPRSVRAVAESERLAHGYLFNPAFATEISQIDPLPHQRIAVYDYMVGQARLRFLLADDAGAGKTIMAGLYIREMLSRGLIRRVLIVPPAGLVGNWERELRTLFRLPFRIIAGSEAGSGSPFRGNGSDLVVVSVDTLAGEKMFNRLREAESEPYDLVIFDEAHKLSAFRDQDLTVRKTDRYELAEALAGVPNDDERWHLGWSAHHLLLLTATPHMGKDFPYYALWRLLEPEALSTMDAFNAYPDDAKRRHFLRRAKEEMVRYDGTAIYPQRITDTVSFDLTQGEVSEQKLYDDTTKYINTYYNQAKILNRSAARLAMSVFQRRMVSSTYALMRSLERRLERLEGLIEVVRTGRQTMEQLQAGQKRLDAMEDPLDTETADEEAEADGREAHELVEDEAMSAMLVESLPQLEVERDEVARLVQLAGEVYRSEQESKFEKLNEVLQAPKYRDRKMIIFTEHKDTLDFLVSRLERMGFTNQVARIHGGMPYQEREEQVEFFRRPANEGGATYLVATDAAGEGINLQFAWLMVNYDIPFNPARLEQRLGRIHRYGQEHDPVVMVNIVAGKTREGHVLNILLEKLERIRKELHSDKVFDVVGRLFQDVPLTAYMAQALSEQGAREVEEIIEGRLTKEQVRALEERERRLYGEGGDVRARLKQLNEQKDHEKLLQLLPGYVRQFMEVAAPLLELHIEGDLDGLFTLRPLRTGAMDPFWPALETYPEEQRQWFTVRRPETKGAAVFLHPGEPFFDRLHAFVQDRFHGDAARGAVFVDPSAKDPYLFHLAAVTVERKADRDVPAYRVPETMAVRLVGLKQFEDGTIEDCAVEQLLMLRDGRGDLAGAPGLTRQADDLRTAAQTYLAEVVARGFVDAQRDRLCETLTQRLDFVNRGFDFQTADLATQRKRFTDRARAGDPAAKARITRIREQQQQVDTRRAEALDRLRREPELVAAGEVTFLAHALVVPSQDPEDQMRRDTNVERIAIRVAREYERLRGAEVTDVSTPQSAVAAKLPEWPGFDLLSVGLDNEQRCIEVKGRAGGGSVELSQNEWTRAFNLRERYWLYVVFDCSSAHPRLMRIHDPVANVATTPLGGVIIQQQAVFEAAAED